MPNKEKRKFFNLLKSKLKNKKDAKIAMKLFNEGRIPYETIINESSIDPCLYIKTTNIQNETVSESGYYHQYWENSIQVKGKVSWGPRGEYYNYVLIDKNTLEITAIGEEQGNYAGGEYMHDTDANWDSNNILDKIKTIEYLLYENVIHELNERKHDLSR